MLISQVLTILALLAVSESCLTDEDRIPGLTRRLSGNDTSLTEPVLSGDRFKDGKVLPRGLGSQPPGTTIKGVMNLQEIESAVKALQEEYDIQYFTAPEKTHGGRTLFGAKVGEFTCDDAYRVFLMAGLHARERGTPDGLIYFISDLLYADAHGEGLIYGDNIYSSTQVREALYTGVIFMPIVNLDGMAYDQETNSCWRRNRNPGGAVDLNRNFDWLWDFRKQFAPNMPITLASDNVLDETYHGTEAFSEPETRNIKWVMDHFTKLRWFADLHSYGSEVLWPWGSDTNQVLSSTMNFQNSFYDGVRGLIPDPPGKVYGEYMILSDLEMSFVAGSLVEYGMDRAAGRGYRSRPAYELGITSGASVDYALGRAYADSNLNKIYGLTIEVGIAGPGACTFYPSPEEFNKNILEMGGGLMEFLIQASRQGLGEPRGCSGQGQACAKTCVPGVGDCGQRASCEYFNPVDGAPTFGNSFCFCQAGYKVSGASVEDGDTTKQYHVRWENTYGDQTHRVLVNPGQDCEAVCGDNRCSEVKTKNSCR